MNLKDVDPIIGSLRISLSIWSVPTVLRYKHKAVKHKFIRESSDIFGGLKQVLIYERFSSLPLIGDRFKLVHISVMSGDDVIIEKELKADSFGKSDISWDVEPLKVKFTRHSYKTYGELIK